MCLVCFPVCLAFFCRWLQEVPDFCPFWGRRYWWRCAGGRRLRVISPIERWGILILIPPLVVRIYSEGGKVRLLSALEDLRCGGGCLVEILKMIPVWDSEDVICSRSVWELVIWTQPSGPLCLWQCFSVFLCDVTFISDIGWCGHYGDKLLTVLFCLFDHIWTVGHNFWNIIIFKEKMAKVVRTKLLA